VGTEPASWNIHVVNNIHIFNFIIATLSSNVLLNTVYANRMCWFGMPLYCLPEIGDFSSKHAGEFMFTDDLCFYNKLYIWVGGYDDYSHNERNK
jgi:hypothetical protein